MREKGVKPKIFQNNEFYSEARPRASLHLAPVDAYCYQQQNLQVMLGLFLQAQGQPLPQSSTAKSTSALSRFLNHSNWSTRDMIRAVRCYALAQLLGYRPRGGQPWLQVIVDLTTLEKRGKFKAFAPLLNVLQGKRGLHLVIVYLVVGYWRVPWSFRVYEAKASALLLSWHCA